MSTVTTRHPSGERLALLLAGALVGLVAAIALGSSLAPARAADEDRPPEHSITVNGTGRILIEPDVADLTLGISLQRERARQASQDAAEIMQAVIAALRGAGVAEEDIQTTMLSLQPTYDYSDGQSPRITGYQVDDLVSVTIRDIARIGEAIDAAVDAGATNVGGITFSVDDRTAAEQRARTAAMADARARADALADAGSVNITGIITIAETSSPVYPYPSYAERGAADAETPVQPGNVELSVTVMVVYSIG